MKIVLTAVAVLATAAVAVAQQKAHSQGRIEKRAEQQKAASEPVAADQEMGKRFRITADGLAHCRRHGWDPLADCICRAPAQSGGACALKSATPLRGATMLHVRVSLGCTCLHSPTTFACRVLGLGFRRDHQPSARMC